ncbi:MAG: HEAT repeat domain-containing protein [Candidatus Micrarchaeia archaeon]
MRRAAEKGERAFADEGRLKKARVVFGSLLAFIEEPPQEGWESRREVEAALRKLARLAPASVEVAKELIRSGGPRERLAACHALGELRAPAGVAALILALEDEKEWVRVCAGRALRKIEDKEGLIAALLAKNTELLARLAASLEGKG